MIPTTQVRTEGEGLRPHVQARGGAEKGAYTEAEGIPLAVRLDSEKKEEEVGVGPGWKRSGFPRLQSSSFLDQQKEQGERSTLGRGIRRQLEYGAGRA